MLFQGVELTPDEIDVLYEKLDTLKIDYLGSGRRY